jgi:DtxR family Mn-dependent transcriptional regulator
MVKKSEQSHIPESDLSHSMVHYLLTIHKLKEGKGYARVTDIAKELKLTKGSVSTAVNNLKKRDLVTEEEDSKFLLLTDSGHDEVHRILSSRTLLFYFLRDFVGVSEDTAENDSCQMELLLVLARSLKGKESYQSLLTLKLHLIFAHIKQLKILWSLKRVTVIFQKKSTLRLLH